MLINGEWVQSKTSEWIEVRDPATQDVLSLVPEMTGAEFDLAVRGAKDAFPAWRATPPSQRARVMLRLQEAINANMDELAAAITREQGKTLADARGDVFRGLEVVEAMAGMPSLLMGELVENVSRGIDTYSIKQPLGVTGGICPFNFPAMIPLWMFPVALTAGNTMVLKPSEKDPAAAMMLADLALQAGLPKGVLQIVHGSKGCVNALLEHPDVKSISFVGSTPAGKYIATKGAAHGKRVQSNMGAKNHALIMPDADVAQVANALAGASFAAAGQRCMALSAVVVVGDDARVDAIAGAVAKLGEGLKLGAGKDDGTDVGPLITPEAAKRAEDLITEGESKASARALSVRRRYQPPTHPHMRLRTRAYTSPRAHCTALHCTALHCTALHCTAGCGADPASCARRARAPRRAPRSSWMAVTRACLATPTAISWGPPCCPA